MLQFSQQPKTEGETNLCFCFYFLFLSKNIKKKKERNLPFLGKSGTTRILVLIPWIRGSSSSLFPDIVDEENNKMID